MELALEQTEKIESRYGTLEVPGHGDLISDAIREYGEWAFLECLVVASMDCVIREVLDIGAYIGTFSLGLSTLLGEDVVSYHCVEANTQVFGLLQRNLDNCLKNSSHFAINATLTEDPHQLIDASISISSANLGGLSLFGNPEVADEGSPIQTALGPGKTLGEIRQDHGLIPDLIKLDVEGMELAILRGDADWLDEARPLIWAECNEHPGVFELLDFFWSLDYNVFFCSFQAYNPENFTCAEPGFFCCECEAALVASPDMLDCKLPRELSEICVFEFLENKDQLRELLWATPRPSGAELVNYNKSQLRGLLMRQEDKADFSQYLPFPR